MPILVKIPIPTNNTAHHRFEWKSEEYKKIVGFFCSPNIQLALVFNDGRQVFLRQYDFENAPSVPPNSRVIFVNKDLDNEVITGVVSIKNLEEGNKAIYLILEK